MAKRTSVKAVLRDAGKALAVSKPLPSIDPFLDMIERAARDPSVDVNKMEKLLSFRDTERKQQSAIRFGEALTAAKQEFLPVLKSREVNLPKGGSYKYEDLQAVVAAVQPALNKNFLDFRYRTQSDMNSVTVTCILYGLGHTEENSLTAAPDKSGAKNDVQAVGSIVTYLQRYTLKACLGIAAAQDDDGRGAGNGGKVSDEQLWELGELIKEAGANVPAFCQYMQVDLLPNLPASKFEAAKRALQAKIEKRKEKA